MISSTGIKNKIDVNENFLDPNFRMLSFGG